jgi:glycosyltransferase involved in cell wall biosynthesis
VRVLVATDQWFPDLRGGVARVAADSARYLAAGGHEVTVLAPRTPDTLGTGDRNGVHVVAALRRGALPQTLSDVWQTARAARPLRGEFDVAIAHGSSTAAGLLRADVGAPLVYVFHASAPLELRFLHTRVPLGRERLAGYALGPVLEALERRSVRGAARILTLSEFSRGIVADRHPAALDRTTVVAGAVDTERFAPGDRDEARSRLGVDPKEPLVFTVRRLVPRMGLEELIDAAALLGPDSGVHVAIAGHGPLAGELERRRQERGARVTLLGRVEDDALVDWYRAADLVVVPTVAYEGFGLVTAEALACGTPVVGTPVGATPELLRPIDERLVADGTAPDELAATVRVALELATDELRDRCRSVALDRFSWRSAIVAWEAELDAARGAVSRRR